MNLESPAKQVNGLWRRPKPTNRAKPRRHKQHAQRKQQVKSPDKCTGCGSDSHPSNKTRDTECHFCHKLAHFSKVCRKKKEVHELHESNNEHSLFLETLEIDSGKKNKVLKKKIHASIKAFHKRTTSITCKIDAGAEGKVVSKTDYDKISANSKRKSLDHHECSLRMADKPLTVLVSATFTFTAIMTLNQQLLGYLKTSSRNN